MVYIEELIMPKLAMYVPLKARPGKESDVADFLTSALALVQAEPGTLTAYSGDAGQALNRRGITHPEGRDVFHGNAAGAAGRRPKHGETGLVLVGERGQSAFLPSQCAE